MTIAALCAYDNTNKTNQVLFARLFVALNRTKANAIIHAFPKLLTLNANNEAPFIQSDNIRYFFTLQYNIYFVVVVDCNTPTPQDICNDTLLPLFHKVTAMILAPKANHLALQSFGLPIDQIPDKIFDLFTALDELVLHRGYLSDWNLSVELVETNLQMSSHEEERWKMLQSGKMQEAKAKARQKAMELDHAKKIAQHTGMPMQSISSDSLNDRIVGIGSGSMQSGSGGNYGGYGNNNNNDQDDDYVDSSDKVSNIPTAIDSYNVNKTNNNKSQDIPQFSQPQVTFTQAAPAATLGKSTLGKPLGRKLGAGKTTTLGKKPTQQQQQQESIIVEEEPVHVQQQQQQQQQQINNIQQQQQQQSQQQPQQSSTPMNMNPTQQQNTTLQSLAALNTQVEEKCSILIDSNNTIKEFNLNGKLHILTTSDLPTMAPIIQLAIPSDFTESTQSILFHTGPNPAQSLIKTSLRPGLDKNTWNTNSCLLLTDPTKPYPVNNKSTILQWKLNLTQSHPQINEVSQYLVPLHTTFWAQNDDTTTTIQVECQVNQKYLNNPFSPSLNNVILSIPCPHQPTNITGLNLPMHYDAENFILHIQLGSIMTVCNQQIFGTEPMFPIFDTGLSFEFTIPNGYDQEQFSPLHITMQPTHSMVGYNPVRAYDPTDSSELSNCSHQFNVQIDAFAIDLQ